MTATKVSTPKLIIGIVAAILAVLALVYSFTDNAAICGRWEETKYGVTVQFDISPFGTMTMLANDEIMAQDQVVHYSISGDEITLSRDGNVVTSTYKFVDNTLVLSNGYESEILTRAGIAYMQVGAWVASALFIILALVFIIGCKKKVEGTVPAYSPVAPAAPYAPAAQPAAPVAPATPYAPAAQPAAPVAPATPYPPAAQPAAPVAPAAPYAPAAQPAAPATAEGIVSTFKPSGTTTESDNGGSEFFTSGADL